MATIQVIEKPTTIEEYKRWLRSNHRLEISNVTQTHYEAVAIKAQKDLELSPFWNDFLSHLKEVKEEYLLATAGYDLFQTETLPKILTKPFESLVDKSFRKNVVENGAWPNPPQDGWVFPPDWIRQINDCLRTSIVVKYMDGVEFVLARVKSLCERNGIKCDTSFEARAEGYYAAHLFFSYGFRIPTRNWDLETTDITIEIQIRTQLQDLIRDMTHRYYEVRRIKPKAEGIKWQWDYQSEEFVPFYLGHILHYVEGMIMEIRDKNRRG